MLSDFPLSDLALSDMDQAYTEAVGDSLATILANPHLDRSWLLEAFPRDADTSTDPPTLLSIYLSTDGHRNKPTDADERQYRECLVSPYDISFEVDGLYGQSEASVGEIVIGDADASLRSIVGEDWQGRQCDVFVGPKDGDQIQFGKVGRLISRGVSAARDVINLIVDDYTYALNKQLQSNAYAGTGGLNGDAEIAGQLRPILIGRARRFEPKLVSGTSLIYQVHDGAVQAIDGVDVAGVALVFDADYADITTATPASGEYATSLATGYIKLGSTPAGAVVVSSAQGHNSSSYGYVDSISGILKLLAVDFAGLDANDLDLVSFGVLDAYTAEMGVYIDYAVEVLDVVNMFHESAYSWGWIRPDKQFVVGRVSDPALATNYFTVDAAKDQLRDEDWEDEPFEPVVWRVSVKYRPYQRTLTDTEIDASVSITTRRDYGREYRSVEASDSTVLVQTPEAREIEITTFLDDEADAQTLADEQLALRSTPRRLQTVSPRVGLISRGIGDVFELTDSRLPGGVRKFVIMSVENSAATPGDPDRIVWQAFG